MATKPEFLTSKKDILAALATVSVAILSPAWLLKYYACVKPAAKLAPFPFFWGPSLIQQRGIVAMARSGGNTNIAH